MLKSPFPYISALLLMAMPADFVHAQPETFRDLVDIVIDLLQTAIPVLLGLAVLLFFWGLAQYVFHAGSEESLEGSKARMLWGIIGLFTIAGLWGLVYLVANTFGLPLN